ncbi:MAG TPA: glycosyltransferase [Terriglobales bacterium]|nr:glycosyltransferase [Terriglobales bacterium]
MKICLVTAFPPGGRQLNEYGLHLARELQKNPLISLTVMGDRLEEVDFATDANGTPISLAEELPEFDVLRCWKFNSVSNPHRIMKALRQIRPDVVWFNLVFSTFGTQQFPVAAFAGLCIPAMVRAAGYNTHVTLHHIMEHVDMSAANIKAERMFRMASSVATRMLLLSNSITVLLPAYRRTLVERYRAQNVHFRSHGILGARPERPDFSRRGKPDHRVLAIGHWGTYKRLETLFEAFPRVLEEIPNAKLVVAGANHHTMPGYWESFAEKYRGNDRYEFRGYVPEDDIPGLYASSSVVVLPYNSSTGSSGPAHQACQYGLPIISSDIPEFRDMAIDEHMAVDFFPIGDAFELGKQLVSLLSSAEKQQAMAEHNFFAALRMTMPQLIREYLRSFDLQERTRLMDGGSGLRRAASWSANRSRTYPYGRWAPWT